MTHRDSSPARRSTSRRLFLGMAGGAGAAAILRPAIATADPPPTPTLEITGFPLYTLDWETGALTPVTGLASSVLVLAVAGDVVAMSYRCLFGNAAIGEGTFCLDALDIDAPYRPASPSSDLGIGSTTWMGPGWIVDPSMGNGVPDPPTALLPASIYNAVAGWSFIPLDRPDVAPLFIWSLDERFANDASNTIGSGGTVPFGQPPSTLARLQASCIYLRQSAAVVTQEYEAPAP